MPGEDKYEEKESIVTSVDSSSSELIAIEQNAHYMGSLENLKAASEARLNKNLTLAIAIANKIIQENSHSNSSGAMQKRSLPLLALTNIFLCRVYYEQENLDLASVHYSAYLFFDELMLKFYGIYERYTQYEHLRDTAFQECTEYVAELDLQEHYQLWKYCFENGCYNRLEELRFLSDRDHPLASREVNISDIKYCMGLAKKALYLMSANITQAEGALDHFFQSIRSGSYLEMATYSLFACEQQIMEIFASEPSFTSYFESKLDTLSSKIVLTLNRYSQNIITDFELVEPIIKHYYARALCYKLLGDAKKAFNDYMHAAELAYTFSANNETGDDDRSYWVMFTNHCEEHLNALASDLTRESKDAYSLARIAPYITFTRINHDNVHKYNVLALMPTIINFVNAKEYSPVDPRFFNSRPQRVNGKYEMSDDVFTDSPVVVPIRLSGRSIYSMMPTAGNDSNELRYKDGLYYKGLYFHSRDYADARKALDFFFSLRVFDSVSKCVNPQVFAAVIDIAAIIKPNNFLENYLRTKIIYLTKRMEEIDRRFDSVENFNSRAQFLLPRALCHKLLGQFKEAYSDYTIVAKLTLTILNGRTKQEGDAILISEKNEDKAEPKNSAMYDSLDLFHQHCMQNRVAVIRELQQTKSDVLNWSRISVVTAFARANSGNAIRDSILALVPTITRLTDADRYTADELQLIQELTTLTPK